MNWRPTPMGVSLLRSPGRQSGSLHARQSQPRNAGAAGEAETLKYYYDGSNVLAEYDPADNLSPRYIHGMSFVDERAVLLEGDPDGTGLDTYYYLLEDLYTVTGLLHKNGQLAEAYNYGSYGDNRHGDVGIVSYHLHDLDRDGGVVDSTDRFMAYQKTVLPDDDPLYDVDFDGDSDSQDHQLVLLSWMSSIPSGVELRTSGIGNPYFFTGRRKHFIDDLSLAGINDNKHLQYNRARHYDPRHGRWLQRDPLGTRERITFGFGARPRILVMQHQTQRPGPPYHDGMNLYEYSRSAPLRLGDPYGMWGFAIHRLKTQEWAEQIGYISSCARTIAEAADAVDSYFNSTSPMYYTGDFRFHFDTDEDGFQLMPGARRSVANAEFNIARQILNGASGNAAVNQVLRKIGRGLHPIQDIYSHSASHNAQIPFDHSPWEHCLYWNDPTGEKIDVCVNARRNNPNWNNAGRPDDETLWPADVVSTMLETKAILRTWLNTSPIDCICKK